MRLLVLEDDTLLGEVFREALTAEGHDVTVSATIEDAIHHLSVAGVDLIIADLWIGNEACFPVLDYARFFQPAAEVILVTGSGMFPHGEMHYSISDVTYRVQKPVPIDELTALVAHCARTMTPPAPHRSIA